MFALLVALLMPAMAQSEDLEEIRTQKTTVNQANENQAEGGFPTVVLPESTTNIRLSSSDINRVACPSEISEALTSTEKGVTIKITGKDAFVKFKVMKRGDKYSYSSTPTELYFVCGDKVFSMVAFPQRVPSQTIRLSSGLEKKIRENLSLYAGLPFEKKVLKALKEVFTESIPDSYTISKQEKRFYTFKEILLTLKRTVDIEGEGLRIKEYEASLRSETPEFKMNEKMFLRTALVDNPIAISLERHVLRTGDSSRVFVVEQRAERQSPRKLAIDLPVMDQPKQGQPAAKTGIQKESPTNRTEQDSQEADDER
jgi:conjugal transfer pilus assembly protein TraK